jgi:hydroxylamine dehydrogenase
MNRTLITAVALFCMLAGVAGAVTDVDSVAGKCMTCHKEKSLGLYNQWYKSAHAKHNVTCLDCHKAQQGDADGFMHEGALIATLVTPKDCGRCHEKEAQQVGDSYHAHAGEILESADAYLAHAAGGAPVAIAGCESCHGTRVKIDPESPNKLHRLSWPNSGIGRLNPDGSKGACTACHTRHAFSVKQARQPEACGKCHLGPDHPQKEVYEESKHGNAYFTHVDEMNLDADRWVVGVDYFEAPTCATCHMSATTNQAVTHDVGERISWTLRPPVSKTKDNWETKRKNMKDVCVNCHGAAFVDGHYAQLDGLVNLYNEKFAKPGLALYKLAKEKKLGEGTANFSNKYEWIWWEIWHHEGRRARHGAAMMGPDYTWWHGIYDVAQHFYFKYVPELRKFHDPDVDKMLDEVLADPFHNWLNRPTADIKADIKSGKMAEMYEDMYKVSSK